MLWGLQIQDTPGYGDDLNIWNNIQSMLAYVEQQNRAWLQVEQDRKRTVPLSDLEDPRVDLCLFCLPPHRLRPVDLRYVSIILVYTTRRVFVSCAFQAKFTKFLNFVCKQVCVLFGLEIPSCIMISVVLFPPVQNCSFWLF